MLRDDTYEPAAHFPSQENSGSAGVEERSVHAVYPVISVIIPTYQEEKLLENTLKAFSPVLRRKFSLEIIVSDGGSTDRTIEIAKRYADKITVHAEKRRQTISEGRNEGARIAAGRTLLFINGDTVPDKPEAFFEFIHDWSMGKLPASRCGALACRVHIAPEERKWSDRLFHPFFNNYIRLLNIFGIGMARGECQIIRKDIFDAIGGYNSAIAAGEDFDLYKRIGQRCRIYYARELCVYESPRRFRRYGYGKILLSWTLNALSVLFLKKSASKEWEPIR